MPIPHSITPVLLATMLAAAPADGAETAVPGRDARGDMAPADLARACPNGVISDVFIANASLFDAADPNLQGRFGWAFRTANALHVRTRDSVIRRELLFGPGDCFEPFLLAESERILRRYEFLARVDIFGVALEDGSYHVIVDTRDDWSTQLSVRMRTKEGFAIDGAHLRETNLAGTGQALGAFYYERNLARHYGVSYHTPQLFRSRWDLRADLGRTRAGTYMRQEVAYPFVGEVGRWAGRQSFLRDDRFFEYVVPGHPASRRTTLILPLRETFADIALLRRMGGPGASMLIGAAVSHQKLAYPGVAELLPGGDFERRHAPDSALAAAVLAQTLPLSNTRLFGILGQRNVWWVKRQGFDSVRGQQDVALGGEALLALGRSLPVPDTDDDMYASFNVYAGMELGDALVVGRGRADARRNLDAPATLPEWEDFFGAAELLAYVQHDRLPGNTLVLRAAAAGAWHTRTPFQLTLGGERAVRGLPAERFPGGRRVVFTAETRSYLGWPLPALFDLGSTFFVDVGRMWPGDAPFGERSGWRGGIGGGLRGSFPAGGRTTMRLDVAAPLQRRLSWSNLRVIVSVGELLGLTDRTGDLQFLRSRPETVAGSLAEYR